MGTNAYPGSVDEYFQTEAEGSDADAADTPDTPATPTEQAFRKAGILAPKKTPQGQNVADLLRELAPIRGGGYLLEERNPARILKALQRGVDSYDRLRKNRLEQGKHWDLVVEGAQFSVLEKTEDMSIWRQSWVPGAPEGQLPVPNKVADLKGKIVSQVLADQFLPDPKPDGANSEKARAAADLLKKFLRRVDGVSGIDLDGMLNECLNTNQTWKSAYAWFWVNKTGGGWRPLQKLAHPFATDPANPLIGPKLGPDGQPITFQSANGPVTITEETSDPVMRYVTEDGEFTDDPAAAGRMWIPKFERRVLRTPAVMTFPMSATVPRAKKITLALVETLDEAKERFPILTTLSESQLGELCRWRPPGSWWKSLIPDALRPKQGEVRVGSDGTVDGSNLFFWYQHYCRVGAEYMDGASIAISGGLNNGFLLERDTLREDIEAEDGTTVPVLRDPPVAQFKGYSDVRHGDPEGIAPVAQFGGAYEMYAHIYTALLEFVDKALHPNVYIPWSSSVTKQEYNRRDGTPIDIMSKDDQPFIETVAQAPAFVEQLLEKLEMALNSLARTNETSNGLDSTYSQSGIAKDVAIRQAKVGLMEYWQNTVDGVQWTWKILHQLAMTFLDTPQEVMLLGTESAYKQRWFLGSDLLGVREIPLQSGSGTMQSPMEKVQLLTAMVSAKFIDQDKAGEVARATMSDDIGLLPDVHEERVDREIGLFLEGPPKDWLTTARANAHAQQTYQTAIQQRVAVLTQSGLPPQAAQQQAMQERPQPPQQPLWTPFTPHPNDEEPGVAKIRALKLSKMIDTPEYTEQPDEWKALASNEYNRMFKAAGGQTVAQQQAAQAQQPGQDDPTFQKFYQETEQSVLSLIRSTIAKAVAAQFGAGAPQGSQPAQPDPAAEMAMRAHEANVAANATAANADAQRAHDATQAALDRQHESRENALDRSAKQRDSVFKSALDAHVKAQQAAQRERQVSLARESVPGMQPVPV